MYIVYRYSRQYIILSMKLTTKSEYSLLALVYIVRNQKRGEYLKIEDICRKYDIDKKYLEQLMAILKSTGIVKTKRGSHGGYQLTKPANRISIAEIIRLFDGSLAPTESASKYFFNKTPLYNDEKVLEQFKEIRDYIAKKLENLKLSDLK